MKKLKKLITIISTSTMIIAISAQGVYASEEIKEISKQAENKIEDLINVEDGYFNINVEDEQQIIAIIGKDYFEVIQNALDGYNESVENGDIEITDNGTIIDNGDNSLNVQGGNTTKQVRYWWGVKNYMSYSTAKTYISKLSSINSKVASVSTVAGLYGGIVGLASSGLSVALAGVVSLLGGALSWYVGGVRDATNKVFKKLPSNKKNGLVVEFKFWLSYRCYKQ